MSIHVSHRLRSEIKYQQKNHWGEVLNFFLSEDHKTTLTFCQVIILLYTSSNLDFTRSTPCLNTFWPAGFIPPPNDWNLTDIFFPKWILWGRCAHRTSATSTSAPFPRPNCRALCVTTTSTTSAHPLLLGGDQGDNVTLQKSQPGRGQRHTVHTCPHISTPFHICPHTFLEVHCCDTVGQQLVVRNTYWFRALKPTHPLF